MYRLDQRTHLSPYISSIIASPDESQLLIPTASDLFLLDSQSLTVLSSHPVPDITQVHFDQRGIWYSNRQGCALFDVRSGKKAQHWNCMHSCIDLKN